MVADTIVIILMIAQPVKSQENGRFKDAFEQADKRFEKEYKLEIEKMKKASQEAAKEAFIETLERMNKKLGK